MSISVYTLTSPLHDKQSIEQYTKEFFSRLKFDFDYKENIFFQEDVGDAIKIYDKYYQKLKVDTGE